jgi:hypothetical protein
LLTFSAFPSLWDWQLDATSDAFSMPAANTHCVGAADYFPHR